MHRACFLKEDDRWLNNASAYLTAYRWRKYRRRSPRDTVERHRANLMAKLDVHDVAGLTRIALAHGLIFIDE